MMTTPEPLDAGRYVARFELTPLLMVRLLAQWLFAVAWLAGGIWVAGALSGLWGAPHPSPIDPESPGGEPVAYAVVTACWVIALAIMGGTASTWTIPIATKRVALCLDRDGVTLGGTPFSPRLRRRAVTVPWADINTILIFGPETVGFGKAALSFVWLELHPDAARKLGIPEPGSTGDWPDSDHLLRRDKVGWRVDAEQVRRTAHSYAPQVNVFHRRG